MHFTVLGNEFCGSRTEYTPKPIHGEKADKNTRALLRKDSNAESNTGHEHSGTAPKQHHFSGDGIRNVGCGLNIPHPHPQFRLLNLISRGQIPGLEFWRKQFLR